MALEIPDDLAEKAALMQEYGRRLAAGEPVSHELYAALVSATNDHYATGPEPGQRIPDFALPDQRGDLRSLSNLSGPNGCEAPETITFQSHYSC
jgi:hypothetical protein